VCHRCSCPAQATLKQIQQHRSSFLESGEKLSLAAAQSPEPVDMEIVARVLLIPLGLVLGFWPFAKRVKK
jgi:hypothetical protein